MHISSIYSPFFTYIRPSFHISRQPSHILNSFFWFLSILLWIIRNFIADLLLYFYIFVNSCSSYSKLVRYCSSSRRINYLANSITSFSNYPQNGVIIFIFLFFSSTRLFICLGLFQPISKARQWFISYTFILFIFNLIYFVYIDVGLPVFAIRFAGEIILSKGLLFIFQLST